MFCSKCGTNNPDGATFCSGCGAPLAAPQQAQAPQQPYAQAPQQPQQPYGQAPQQPYAQGPSFGQQMQNTFSKVNPKFLQPFGPGLIWASLLGYIFLWIGGIINLVQGFRSFGYVGMASWLGGGFSFFFVLTGILLIVVAALDGFTAFCIITKKKLALLLAPCAYFAAAVVTLIQLIFAFALLGSWASQFINIASVVVQMLIGIAVGVVNYIYFNKRKHIFTV